MAFADRVLTVNRACERIFGERSCPPEKIGVVMNAPDEKIFPFRSSGISGAARRTEGKPFVMMYHGSIVERNGLQLAVDALARIVKTVPSAELRIFGRSTPFLESVMADAQAKGLAEQVRYLGPRRLEELVAEIEGCDVGVIPNQENAFTDINTPTRIFEYLSLGKPVIAPRTRGILDYFEQDSLMLFQAGDADDLARTVEHAALYPGAALETARRGQQVYLGHTWWQEKQKLIDLVTSTLPAGNARKRTNES
jgi:glycosyltransferase involved in cell wall biosynthesis